MITISTQTTAYVNPAALKKKKKKKKKKKSHSSKSKLSLDSAFKKQGSNIVIFYYTHKF